MVAECLLMGSLPPKPPTDVIRFLIGKSEASDNIMSCVFSPSFPLKREKVLLLFIVAIMTAWEMLV